MRAVRVVVGNRVPHRELADLERQVRGPGRLGRGDGEQEVDTVLARCNRHSGQREGYRSGRGVAARDVAEPGAVVLHRDVWVGLGQCHAHRVCRDEAEVLERDVDVTASPGSQRPLPLPEASSSRVRRTPTSGWLVGTGWPSVASAGDRGRMTSVQNSLLLYPAPIESCERVVMRVAWARSPRCR